MKHRHKCIIVLTSISFSVNISLAPYVTNYSDLSLHFRAVLLAFCFHLSLLDVKVFV